jgi:hypothetical protein
MAKKRRRKENHKDSRKAGEGLKPIPNINVKNSEAVNESSGLFSSIFGSQNNGSSGNDLFSTSKVKEWEQLSSDLKKKNQTFHGKKDSLKRSKSLSREDIIQARRKLTRRSDGLVNSITVDIPKIEDEVDEDKVISAMRLFSYHCDEVFREKGVILMRKRGQGIIPRQTLEALATEAKTIEGEICNRLDEKGKLWQVGNNDVCDMKSLELEQTHSFQYDEVASRCLGRLDIRHGMERPPFSQQSVISNQFLMPFIKSILGEGSKLLYAGLILSFKNSADQPWHQDGDRLFQSNEFPDGKGIDFPPYAVNVFIPLDNVKVELGPTEFCVGSHIESKAQAILQQLSSGSYESDEVIAPLLNFGDALIYDYRICHRGTRNLAEMNKTRPMLYLMYARPWFHEHLNFGHEKLFH